MKKFVKNKYVIVTLIIVIIYLIYLKLMKIFPFGENSILKSDLYQQYINFLCYLRKVLLHGKSIVISWNMGLANNFYTTFAYYLMSPLNLFVIFFDSSNMDIFVEIITCVKIILMGNFFILFLEKSYNYKSNEIIIFGLIYAFSSYVICYSFHIMWLDCVYMLPIVLLFVDKYIENGKIYPLVFSLAYSILTNYYIGYIVAFFSGVYFLAKIFIERRSLKQIFKFLLAIAISFGIGMIVILPSILQLKGNMNPNIELIKIDFDKLKFLINVPFNNYVYAFSQKSCFIFSSTLTILLLPMYYLNKNISKREKIGFTAIIVFLMLPLVSPFFNKLWHAFTVPNCFNYRYSFTLIFILVLMVAREFQNKEHTKKWHFIISFVLFTVLTIIEVMFYKRGYLEADGFSIEKNSIVISSVIYLIMWFATFGIYKNKRTLSLALWLIVIIDLLIGAKSGQRNNDVYFKRKIVLQYDNFMSHFIPKLECPEFERIVFEPDEYGSNMSLKFGYSNIGFFTSARNRETLKSMYKMGYNVQMDEQLWISSNSGTFLNYSIAGVKYYITRRKLEENELYGFEFEEKYDKFYVYKNKNNFNIGYYLANNINLNDNPFIIQNDFLNELIGEKSNEYFQNIEKSKVLESSKLIDYDENVLNYKVKAKNSCNIYLYSDSNLQLYVNNKPQFKDYSNIWSTETGIKQIKHLEKNEEFEFGIYMKDNLENLYLYVSDNEKIQNLLDSKKNKIFYDVKINKNGLEGRVSFKDEGYLVFPIAYDNCWDIYVDGEKISKEAIAGCFLGTKLKKGTHNIKIKASMFTIK